jgi:hypothetical protein
MYYMYLVLRKNVLCETTQSHRGEMLIKNSQCVLRNAFGHHIVT